MIKKNTILDKLDIEEMLRDENPLMDIRKEARKTKGLEKESADTSNTSDLNETHSNDSSVIDHYSLLKDLYEVEESGEYVNVTMGENNDELKELKEVELVNEEKKYAPKKIKKKVNKKESEGGYFCC
ncbi:hypothetical protein NUSPORA_02910 [Nucleospora cyclopteri]